MGCLELEWLLPSDKSDSVAALLYTCWGKGNRYKKLQDQRRLENFLQRLSVMKKVFILSAQETKRLETFCTGGFFKVFFEIKKTWHCSLLSLQFLRLI